MLLNKKNANGSINLLQVTGEDMGEIISPYHPNFKNQVEDGIWPIVSELLQRGFYVVDSCEGHLDGENNDYSHFAVAFADIVAAEEFKKNISVIGTDVNVFDHWLNVDNEVDFINKLFFTCHTKFVFVNVKILAREPKIVKKLLTRLVRWRIYQRIVRWQF